MRELRTAASLSQEALASAAEITPKYLSQLENGHVNPSVRVLRAIAEEGLKVPLATFFNFTIGKQEGDAVRAELEGILSAASVRDRRRVLAAIRAFCAKG